MGRPRLAKEQKRKQINVRLSPEHIARLNEVIDGEGISLGAYIERLLLITWDYTADDWRRVEAEQKVRAAEIALEQARRELEGVR